MKKEIKNWTTYCYSNVVPGLLSAGFHPSFFLGLSFGRVCALDSSYSCFQDKNNEVANICTLTLVYSKRKNTDFFNY